MTEKQYIIGENELWALLTSSLTLDALEQGGVDNWEWYSESIGSYFDECKSEDADTLDDAEELSDIAKGMLSNYTEFK